MCWNAESSIAMFIIAFIGIFYLYKRNKPNDRWIALFMGTVAMIQLCEFFMWSDQACTDTNKRASMFAVLILALEPMMAMLGGIYLSDTPYKPLLKAMFSFYILFLIITYITQIRKKEIEWCGLKLCESYNTNRSIFNCNLEWHFLKVFNPTTLIFWMIFLMLPILTIVPKREAFILFLAGSAACIISKMQHMRTSGSLWCWYANAIIYLKILM